jgi:hypothetical protein
MWKRLRLLTRIHWFERQPRSNKWHSLCGLTYWTFELAAPAETNFTCKRCMRRGAPLEFGGE